MQERVFDFELIEKEIEDIRELITEKKYSQVKMRLQELNVADIADIFEELEEKEIPLLFRMLGKEEAAETFARMEYDARMTLINAMTDKEIRQVMDEIFLDDTVDIIEEMPANVVSRLLRNTDEATRKQINEFLKYPKDSAGSVMTVEYVNIKKDMTVGEAIARIRKIAVDKETIYTCYVTENRVLIGVLTVKELLMASDDEKIIDIMTDSPISVNTHDDQEVVAKIFKHYDFVAVPVVDNENRLVGIVTIDDAIDVMEEEHTEDITKMAAIIPLEEESDYFDTSVFSHAKQRILWLVVLMLSATVSGAIITSYEAAFAAVPLLVSFIPMLMGTGGNSGSQSSTLIIRGIALDEIRFKDLPRVIFKEFRISLLVGIILSILNGLRIAIFYKDITLGIVVGISLLFTIMIAKLIGGALPLLAKKVGLDPAIMAAPLITTIVDTCSILIFFQIATMFFQISL